MINKGAVFDWSAVSGRCCFGCRVPSFGGNAIYLHCLGDLVQRSCAFCFASAKGGSDSRILPSLSLTDDRSR